MAQIYNIISIVAFVIAGICFVMTVFFLIKFHIPMLIGELSGRTARKSIEEMRHQNENKKRNSTPVRTEKDEKLSELHIGQEKSDETTLLEQNVEGTTALINDNYEIEVTTLLQESDAAATTLLDDEEGFSTTTFLSNTEELTENISPVNSRLKRKQKKLTMIQSIISIHTDEIIE